ncbi:hypothetical protein DV515_00017045, partial [Chloebia gouldiae]
PPGRGDRAVPPPQISFIAPRARPPHPEPPHPTIALGFGILFQGPWIGGGGQWHLGGGDPQGKREGGGGDFGEGGIERGSSWKRSKPTKTPRNSSFLDIKTPPPKNQNKPHLCFASGGGGRILGGPTPPPPGGAPQSVQGWVGVPALKFKGEFRPPPTPVLGGGLPFRAGVPPWFRRDLGDPRIGGGGAWELHERSGNGGNSGGKRGNWQNSLKARKNGEGEEREGKGRGGEGRGGKGKGREGKGRGGDKVGKAEVQIETFLAAHFLALGCPRHPQGTLRPPPPIPPSSATPGDIRDPLPPRCHPCDPQGGTQGDSVGTPWGHSPALAAPSLRRPLRSHRVPPAPWGHLEGSLGTPRGSWGGSGSVWHPRGHRDGSRGSGDGVSGVLLRSRGGGRDPRDWGQGEEEVTPPGLGSGGGDTPGITARGRGGDTPRIRPQGEGEVTPPGSGPGGGDTPRIGDQTPRGGDTPRIRPQGEVTPPGPGPGGGDTPRIRPQGQVTPPGLGPGGGDTPQIHPPRDQRLPPNPPPGITTSCSPPKISPPWELGKVPLPNGGVTKRAAGPGLLRPRGERLPAWKTEGISGWERDRAGAAGAISAR